MYMVIQKAAKWYIVTDYLKERIMLCFDLKGSFEVFWVHGADEHTTHVHNELCGQKEGEVHNMLQNGKNVTTHMPGVQWARQDRQTALYRVDLLSKLRRILMTDCHRQGRRKAIRWVTRKGWSSPG
ncbi:hypothetical protein CAPTEDRAFT_210795 [Capitella teleta]|uniref:Uncharacterized protein n=1 Tax=Capitella teleta TaxID=283909 RepID=R7U838_CAPTE|nr:hypothetical protein CAPTEDRAFT_210795 [Capitella teleta]|eukprot:ELT99811.1 hypothetical protein CAPTEDRAFT_210795 [Capitella teleta]